MKCYYNNYLCKDWCADCYYREKREKEEAKKKKENIMESKDMTAKEFLDLKGWPNPDSNFEQDLIDAMEEYGRHKMRAILEWATDDDICIEKEDIEELLQDFENYSTS